MLKKHLLFFILFILLVSSSTLFGLDILTDKNFSSMVKDKIYFIDFYADWCGPCIAFAPTFESVSKDLSSYYFGKLDVDSSPKISNRYKIQAIPYIAAIKDSVVLEEYTGNRTESDFSSWCASIIDEHGYIDETEVPALFETKIDAALQWEGDQFYLFRGNQFVLYDSASREILPGYPKIISRKSWSGLSFKSIDAAINWGNGKIYLFKGKQYARFDMASGQVDSGYPKPINERNWPGLSFKSIDSAINWGNGKAYFFKDGQYVRYDIKQDVGDSGYPMNITDSSWPDLNFNQVDAACRYKKKAFIVSGQLYSIYDTISETTDSGYPNEISDIWLDDSDSQNDNQDSGKSEGDFTYFEVLNESIDISPYVVQSPNSVLGFTQIATFENGDIMLGIQQEDDIVLIRLDSNYQRTGNPVVLEDMWLSRLQPMDDGSLVLLAGQDDNNDYLEGYPNTLYIIKLTSRGREVFRTQIFGTDGHGSGKSWFDGRSRARISYNGDQFGVYFEVQKNFAEPGDEDDIHNGDMFVVVDRRGKLLDDRTHFWTASHSSTLNMVYNREGEFVTLTIGDAYPYGLQIYNRDSDSEMVVWPPDEDYIPYEKINSANAPGILEYAAWDNEDIVVLLGTLEHPNIGWDTKVDPLFLRISSDGQILVKRWLEQSPNRDDSKITVVPYGSNYIVGWGTGNDFNNEWKPGNFTFAVIDNQGNFITQPIIVDEPFGSYSRFKLTIDNEVIWTLAKNGSSLIDIYRLISR